MAQDDYGLTGHADFDASIARFSALDEPVAEEALRADIWARYGVEGAMLISDMACFSSISRRVGVCHFLKLIYQTRQLIAPIIAGRGGKLLKCDADNCFALFASVDHAIAASVDINAALQRVNASSPIAEQIYLSAGIDYGRVLLIDDREFFGDAVNTASKLGEDLAVRPETLVTQRALARASFEAPEGAEHMTARVSEIEIDFVRLPMVESIGDGRAATRGIPAADRQNASPTPK